MFSQKHLNQVGISQIRKVRRVFILTFFLFLFIVSFLFELYGIDITFFKVRSYFTVVVFLLLSISLIRIEMFNSTTFSHLVILITVSHSIQHISNRFDHASVSSIQFPAALY